MFSFIGETILDPFTGSGTTSLAAKNLERNSVGYEINPEFIPVIKEKLEVHQKDIQGTSYEFLIQAKLNIDFDNENNLLCYLYLENKTFINAHLLKNGLVKVDNDINFKYKEKFLNLQPEYKSYHINPRPLLLKEKG
jgi:DNA methylase/Staphylococcal nuclease homologue